MNPLTTIVAYYTSWSIYARKFYVSDLACQKLTHVNYAFANIVNGSVVLGDQYADIEHSINSSWEEGSLKGNFGELFRLKERCRGVKTCISIGGWSWSTYFSSIAATSEDRSKFVSSALDFIEMYGFDCVDLDWEYPVGGGLPSNINSPADTQNYVLLVEEFKRQIALIDYMSVTLSIATPCDVQRLVNFNLEAMAPYVDRFNMMCYDFAGSWSPLSDNQSNLSLRKGTNTGLSVQKGVNRAKSKIAAKKIIIGVPFYGRSFKGVTQLLKPFTIDTQGTWEAGVWDYKGLPKGCRYKWDNGSNAQFCVQPRAKRLITFDSPAAISRKLKWARSKGVGGTMFWEASSDITPITNGKSLQRQLARWTRRSTPQNNLCYPKSVYSALKVHCSAEKKFRSSATSTDWIKDLSIGDKALREMEKIMGDPLNVEYLQYPRAHYNYTMFAQYQKKNAAAAAKIAAKITFF